jgi:MFS transporter, BCD family, chlorophyll transporter
MNRSQLLSWAGIVRLGFIQAALGSIVVLATSVMNRIMVVELALPALLPGALVGLHYAVQILRPRLGFGSDVGGRRTPWIVGGMATLGAGAILAAFAIAAMPGAPIGALALALFAFVLIGAGVGSAGTSLLVLLAKRVDERRRAAAATIVWLMMIAGFVVTTIVVGQILDPYSAARLIAITTGVALTGLVVTLVAIHGMESANAQPIPSSSALEAGTAQPAFREALTQVWREPLARRFTLFVFVSMLAYSAQDLILEPFAGAVFALTPGQSTQLSGMQHGGVLVGMILVTLAATVVGGPRLGSLRLWTVLGCMASALALLALAAAGWVGGDWPLAPTVFALGVANGAFAVAAIGSMMSFAGAGRESREGVRMGLWGAAQAVAFGLGGFLGAVASDVARAFIELPGPAYGTVFAAEAALFVLAARLAIRLGPTDATRRAARPRVAIAAALASQENTL